MVAVAATGGAATVEVEVDRGGVGVAVWNGISSVSTIGIQLLL